MSATGITCIEHRRTLHIRTEMVSYRASVRSLFLLCGVPYLQFPHSSQDDPVGQIGRVLHCLGARHVPGREDCRILPWAGKGPAGRREGGEVFLLGWSSETWILDGAGRAQLPASLYTRGHFCGWTRCLIHHNIKKTN